MSAYRASYKYGVILDCRSDAGKVLIETLPRRIHTSAFIVLLQSRSSIFSTTALGLLAFKLKT